MRLVLPALLLVFPALAGGSESKRYGIVAAESNYPQATPRETLQSVLKAIEAGKIRYLVAQLADPGFVDDRVRQVYGGRFDEQVRDTETRLDPATVRKLRRFLAEGKWAIDRDSAVVSLEDVPDRVVRLVRHDGRWYLAHRSDPAGK